MAKFKLFPTGHPDDPFGSKPVSVEISSSPPASGPIRLTTESFLPETSLPAAAPRPLFDDDAPISPEMRLTKINLVPLTPQNDFVGIGDTAPSRSGRVEKFNLAPMASDSYFDLPTPSPSHEAEAAFRKNAAGDFEKVCGFTKIQETGDGNILVWGIATLEQPDLDSEICDYDTAKDAYQAWSLAAAQRTSAAGQQISLGPIRYQHSPEPAGKATKIKYDDDAKEIWLGSVPINDDIRSQLQEGFLTGYSQGGSYAWRKCTDCGKSLTLQQANNYCPACKKSVPVKFGLKKLSEVSYVDSPCTGKGFDYVKADGSKQFVKFAKRSGASNRLDGVKILASVRISNRVWKHTVKIGDQKHFLVMRDDNPIVFV